MCSYMGISHVRVSLALVVIISEMHVVAAHQSWMSHLEVPLAFVLHMSVVGM